MQTYEVSSVTQRELVRDRTVLVTGASRGIGTATARALAEAGASVVLAARDETAIAEIAAEIVEAGGQAIAVRTDVTDELAVERAVEAALATYGRLDAAFNNAGDGHMPAPLADRTVLVTGASRGIGAATARALAQAGASVVLAARDELAISAIAAEIVAAGGQAIGLATDVTDELAVKRVVEAALAAYGRLDAAFNNAGDGHMPAPLADLEVIDLERSLATNVRGVFLSMKYEVLAMLQSGGGSIVNMSSTAGLQGVRGMGAYSAAKHAIVGLTRSAALDYGTQNIRVNAVAPGPIMTERLAALDEENRQRVSAHVPLARLGMAEEVAAVVVWLCSDQSSFVTGATIPVDGGRLAGAA